MISEGLYVGKVMHRVKPSADVRRICARLKLLRNEIAHTHREVFRDVQDASLDMGSFRLG